MNCGWERLRYLTRQLYAKTFNTLRGYLVNPDRIRGSTEIKISVGGTGRR